ncbi:MAG: FAD-binding oxidoreductase [Candidatus Beckwithbacteria bacterium]|nr:FAD-binding oxidoreductase [Candidatus Beckwithbacteria bacterium]
MVTPQQYTAKLSEKTQLNKNYCLFQLELIKPNTINFQAGQYLSLEIGGGEKRAYSIVSTPTKNYGVDLCVDLSPQGKGTTYLKNLQPGDEVKFLGPLGRFIVGREKKLLFVATGCGISPIRSMVFDLLEDKKDKREIWLLWGLRYVEDMFWEEKFRQIDEYYPNFHYRLVLSKPPEKWPVESGHVTDEIKNLDLNNDWGAYLCGNQTMIAEVKQMLQDKGVPEVNIHFEKF